MGALKQNNSNGIRYSAPVPLFCSAFKEYRDIKYSDWAWDEPEARFFLDSDFLAYSQYFDTDFSEKFPTKTLLEYRDAALFIKSGSKAGSTRRPEATAVVYGVNDKDFTTLPRLVKLNLLQLWVFSPSMYNEYIISNLLDLDAPVTPLVTSSITTNTISDTPSYSNNDSNPWAFA